MTRRSCSAISTRRRGSTLPTTRRHRPRWPFRPDAERGDPMTTSLPPEFADLEPFADWCLATEAERFGKRLASSMDDMQAFYDAAFPRLGEILAYLDQLDLAALPDDAGRLLT